MYTFFLLLQNESIHQVIFHERQKFSLFKRIPGGELRESKAESTMLYRDSRSEIWRHFRP